MAINRSLEVRFKFSVSYLALVKIEAPCTQVETRTISSPQLVLSTVRSLYAIRINSVFLTVPCAVHVTANNGMDESVVRPAKVAGKESDITG